MRHCGNFGWIYDHEVTRGAQDPPDDMMPMVYLKHLGPRVPCGDTCWSRVPQICCTTLRHAVFVGIDLCRGPHGRLLGLWENFE